MPKKLTEEELKQKIKDIDSTYELYRDSYTNYKNNRSIIQIRHIPCGNIISTSFKNFQEGKVGCTCAVALTAKERENRYINSIKVHGRGKYLVRDNYLEEIFKDELEYECLTTEYSGNNKDKLKIHHKICNRIFYMKANCFQQGQRCPYCAQLKRVKAKPTNGALTIYNYLDSHHKYKDSEVRFDDCKDKQYLLFDYLDINNNIIEFDGEQHFNEYKRGYKMAQKHDPMKNKYCIKNNINILRIPYTEESNINTILDLFYTNNFVALSNYNIYLATSSISININSYINKNTPSYLKCRSKTV